MTTTVTYTDNVVVVINATCDERYFYVDATGGDDDNDGLTPDTAWQTIAKVNTESASFIAGDHVLFKCGETFAGCIIPGASGGVGNYITYGYYGSGARPIINGTGSNSAYSSSTKNYLAFEHIDFAGSNGVGNTFYSYGPHHIEINDCIIRDSGNPKSGAYINGHDIYIVDTLFQNNYENGLLAEDTTNYNYFVLRCTATGNGHDANGAHGFYMAGGVILESCLSYSNAAAGFKLNDNEVEAFYYPILRYSESYDNNYGIVITHKNATVHNNKTYSNLSDNMQVIGNAWGGYKIYFNTIVNSVHVSNYAIMFAAGVSPNSSIRNNIFVQDHDVVAKPIIEADMTMAQLIANYGFDYNIYYREDTNPTLATLLYTTDADNTNNWTQWTGAGAEAHGVLLTSAPGFVGMPGYTGDYHPANAGNLDGHNGIAIDGYDIDYDGNSRADPPNCGCYEEASA